MAPVLEAELPHKVNGTTLTTESATDATSLSSDPASRALDAAMSSLGKTPADLEVAVAYDPSATLNMSVLGFRVAGIEPAKLSTLVLDTWLSATAPGVTTSSLTFSGVPVTDVSYGDSGPDEYLYVRADSVFVVETTDRSLAESAVAATATPTAAPSGG